jgi:tetratricopeptide (TPR) repeat protein
MRRSEEVVELWEEVLCDFTYKLGSEEWVIYEQVCIAACDCGRLDIAEDCFTALKAQFPSSIRILGLHGLIEEASGKYDAALSIYSKILKKDESCLLARKRKISILRSQNKIVEAIKELNQYLTQYMSDFEGWMELCDLYLQEMDYAKAAFCMEELLLANPYSHLVHQKYAEIRYTQGGADNVELARKYFAQAMKLNAQNMRALFGFYLSAKYLSQKCTGSKKKDNEEYAASAWKQITEKFQSKLVVTQPDSTQKPPQQLLAIKGMFDSLQISSSP